MILIFSLLHYLRCSFFADIHAIFLAELLTEREPFLIESLQFLYVFLYSSHLHRLSGTDADDAVFVLQVLDELQLLVVGPDAMTQRNA